jgi:hypothetical protein
MVNLKDKSELHKIKHISSRKHHIYNVLSSSGNNYDVVIMASCTCRYSSVQGIPNGKPCSHILAVLKKIYDDGDYCEVAE